MAAKKKPEWTFESGLAALEEIARRMEEGELPLEDALRLYEEGKALQKRLLDQLDASEQRLTVLETVADETEETEKTEVEP